MFLIKPEKALDDLRKARCNWTCCLQDNVFHIRVLHCTNIAEISVLQKWKLTDAGATKLTEVAGRLCRQWSTVEHFRHSCHDETREIKNIKTLCDLLLDFARSKSL